MDRSTHSVLLDAEDNVLALVPRQKSEPVHFARESSNKYLVDALRGRVSNSKAAWEAARHTIIDDTAQEVSRGYFLLDSESCE